MIVRRKSFAFIVFLLGTWITWGAGGAEPDKKPGEQWAILIAVQEHEDPKLNLTCPVNDAILLRRTLIERAGMSADHILEMTDKSPADKRPTLANLRRELPRFLAKAKDNDRVIISYSGHGMLKDKQTYLVPADFRPAQAAKTGLPAAEVRTLLAGCPAAVKFLILDCCHAGSARAAEESSLSSDAVGRAFEPKKVPGCVVLASCQAEEKSLESPLLRNGLFTFWLCLALEGGADSDGDGNLTADEVYRYTHERVSQTATQIFKKQQTPVRLIGSDVAGVPVLLTLRPEPPESVCRRLAQQVALESLRKGLKKIGVTEFLEPLRQSEGLARAPLPSYCTERVRLELAKVSGGKFEVLTGESMHNLVKGLKVEEVGKPDAMKRLSDKAGGLDALIIGTLRRRGGKMHLQCDLVATADGNSLITPSGVFPISEEILADNGASFDNRKRPQGSPYAPAVVQHADQAQLQHPLLDKDFPFQVEVWTIQAREGEAITDKTPRKKKELVRFAEGPRKPEDGSQELLIGARPGEIFEVRIKSKWKAGPVAMTLLVDGINSLGQKRERLGKAWSWVVRPDSETTIEGWYIPKKDGASADNADDFTMKRFKFTEVSQSVAGRMNFGESIGVITAAFYREYGRSVAVGEGPEEERTLGTIDFKPGRLIGVVQLRYVDERELKKKLEEK